MREQTVQFHDVLTLEETAAYLRLPKETIERQAAHGTPHRTDLALFESRN